MEMSMETLSVVGFLTIGFAAANLAFQVGAGRYVRHLDAPKLPGPKAALEHPVHSRIDGMPRARANRHDMQLAIGHDFAAPDVQDAVWPRDPRI
jgi:hypothetical protein